MIRDMTFPESNLENRQTDCQVGAEEREWQTAEAIEEGESWLVGVKHILRSENNKEANCFEEYKFLLPLLLYSIFCNLFVSHPCVYLYDSTS